MKTTGVKLIEVFLVLSFLVFLIGCSGHHLGVSTEQETLKVLTPEDIESIFAAVSIDIPEKYPTETDENGLIVYWLDGGTVWHASRECSNIRKADSSKVNRGSVQDALSSGKERQCKICDGGTEQSIITEYDTDVITLFDDVTTVPESAAEKYQKEYSSDGELIVFWLEGSKVWHESRFCSSLSRSDPEKLLYGSVDDAVSSGKERVCKTCSK